MLSGLSLRLRIFLFFGLLAVGAVALAAGSLAFGWSRSDTPLPTGPLVTALIFFGFLNTGLILGVWLLFDENVAKPISRLSAQLRLRAHSGVESNWNADDAKHLGDLASAADALSRTLGNTLTDTAARVASETQRLQSEQARLTALLSEIPIATILLNPNHEIVLYDSQAAEVLTRIAPPRLKAKLSDYFDMSGFAAAAEALPEGAGEGPLQLTDASGTQVFHARLKSLGGGGYMILIDMPEGAVTQIAPRPLVYNFDYLNPSYGTASNDTPLSEQCFVAFDTETTGLSVQNDDIVQIGAVRILDGRIVQGEVVDTYVDPGRPIPPASTRIHGVTDAHVAGAPDIGIAGRALHDFARDAVLVAHNAPFDIGLLRKNRSRTGADWTHPVLDTVLLSAVVFGTTEEHSLDALCDRLAIEIPADRRHTALGDAQATAEVLVRLLPLLEGRGITTLGELLNETRKHGRLLRDMNS